MRQNLWVSLRWHNFFFFFFFHCYSLGNANQSPFFFVFFFFNTRAFFQRNFCSISEVPLPFFFFKFGTAKENVSGSRSLRCKRSQWGAASRAEQEHCRAYQMGAATFWRHLWKKRLDAHWRAQQHLLFHFSFFVQLIDILQQKKRRKRPFCISLSPGDKKRWTQLETIKGARASILWAFKGCDERVAYYDSDRLMRRCVCPVTFTGPSTNFDQLLVSASAAEPIELPRGQFHRGGSEGTRWITFCGRRRRISTGFL